jgi:transposase, IS5 family
VIPEIETQIGAPTSPASSPTAAIAATTPRPITSSRVQGLYLGPETSRHQTIKRELRRRSAVEPVIGHAKSEHRMGRNYLAGTHGDAANAILAAAGYNFRRLLEWLALLLSIILAALTAAASHQRPLKSA